MRFLLAVLVLAALGGGCHRARTAAPASPMDADLRRHLATVAPDVPVDALVGIGDVALDDARRGLEAAGVEVRTVTGGAAGGVAVVRGVRGAIERVAALPWVRQIDLSQERLPTTERPAP